MGSSEPKPSPNKPWLIGYMNRELAMGSVSNAPGPSRSKVLLQKMLTAVSNNNVKELTDAIEEGVDVNYLFEGDESEMGVFQVTALHICGQKGHVESAKILLEHGADPELTASWGQTALMHAVNTQWHNMVETLIASGAKLDSTDYQGRCSLTYAVTNQDVQSLKMLLDAGASIDIGDHYGHTPVHIAARAQNTRCLVMLLEERPDACLDIKDFARRTPLQHAVISGTTDSISLLLDLGAEIDTLDLSNYTPLTNAINQFAQQPENTGYIGKICQLVERGCDLNIQCPSTGRTALHLLMSKSMFYYELIDYFLMNGADANITDKNNCTPLHLSLMSNNKTLGRKLIRENCALDSRAVDIAVMKGMTDMASFMIQGGAVWDRKKYMEKLQTSPYFMYDYPEMVSLLHYSLTTVDSLAQAARTSIRRRSPIGLPRHIDTYGLPAKLREYVLLTEEMEDEYYSQW